MTTLNSNGKFLTGASSEKNVPSTWKLIVDHYTIKDTCKALATAISQKYSEVVLIYILTGGTYFAVDLSRRLSIPHSVMSIKASSYHNEQNCFFVSRYLWSFR